MTTEKSKIIILIPCYNEEKRLKIEPITRFATVHPEISLWLLNDGSTDKTWEIISQLSDITNINGVDFPINQGKAETVRQGMVMALEEKPEMIGFWDGDLATPLEVIPLFVQKLHEAPHLGMVTGCRLGRLGANIKRKMSRHYLGRIFATIISIHLKLGVYDTQCGAKLLTAEYAEIASGKPFSSKWFFDVEIYKRLIAKLGRDKVIAGVYEYPLPEWEDKDGSKVKMFSAMWQLFKVLRAKP